MTEQLNATDEILIVHRVMKDGSDWAVTCPHCKKVIGLEDGPIRGEQFQHRTSRGNGCGGWFEVSHDARVVLP